MIDRAQITRNLVRYFLLILAFATFAAAPASAFEIDPQCAPLNNKITCTCSLQVGGSIHESPGGGGLHSFHSKRAESAFNACLDDARGPGAFRGPRMRVIEANPGAPTLLFTWYNCTKHRPYQGEASVSNGTLTYKSIVKDVCGNPNEPARELWYTPNPGFTGTDRAIVHNGLYISIIVR